MNNLARRIEPESPKLERGRVAASEHGCFTVESTYGFLQARSAAGCLLQPEIGDSVLCMIDMAGCNYILSVLERSGTEPTTLLAEGDTTLRIQGGGLSLAPDGELSFISEKLSIHAEEGEAAVNRFSFIGLLFKSHVERVKTVAGLVDNICREMTTRTVNYFRFTSEDEDCQAKSRRQLVDETLTIQAKNTTIVAEEDVKIDGELIHMG